MRVIVFVVFVVVGLWVVDKVFFKGQYTNELSIEVDRDVRDFAYTVRRWTASELVEPVIARKCVMRSGRVIRTVHRPRRLEFVVPPPSRAAR